MEDWTNQQIGNYEIKELLGQGGMGQVYKGFHPALQRDVAIKMIRTHFGMDDEANERLRHEAQIVAGLRHLNIVQVHDFDIADETFYMVMEFVPGETLEDRLIAIHMQAQRMPLPEALRLFQSITQAVGYAHDQQVVHLDLKPANVLINESNQPILADFGVSKIMGAEGWGDSETVSGSPAYMSPEQCLGETGDARSDIYSLGVMLYHMVTGSLPFSGDTPMALIFKHIDEPPPPARTLNPDLPDSLEVILDKALRKTPSNRYESAQAMLEALDEVVVPLGGVPSMLLDVDAPAPEDTRCPYRGLQSFEPEHAEFYFGREALVNQLIEDMAATLTAEGVEHRLPRFLAVLGASGSGKSSLVRAGLIPALQTDYIADSSQWPTCLMKPGETPLAALATQLAPLVHHTPTEATADSHSATDQLLSNLTDNSRTLHLTARAMFTPDQANHHLLLVVDQFEEVFTLCENEIKRRRFIENLIYAASVSDGRVIVLLTMRADFYHRCAQYRDLANRLAAHQMLVGAMDTAELRRAITQPAQHVGLKFEPGLVDTILADVAQQPGSLPLLQHALLELWERRQGALLTLRAYQASGGVQGAIAQRADTVYQTFDTKERAIVRRIMLRLTELGEEGSQSTSRRTTRQELIVRQEDERAVAAILTRLADARLITTSEETVEVAHEALIREWPTLHRWLEDDQDNIRLHRHLTEAAQEWDNMNRDSSELYSGARMASAVEWAVNNDDEVNPLEREFLDQSLEQQQAVAEEKNRLQQERIEQAEALAVEQRQRAADLRQRAIWLAGIGVVAVILAAAAGWFGYQTTIQAAAADAASREAQHTARISRSRELAAQATIADDSTGSINLMLAREAILTTWHVDTPMTASSIITRPFVTIEADVALRSAISKAKNLPWRRTIPWRTPAIAPVLSVAFSPNGTQVASANKDQTIRLWDAQSSEQLQQFDGHNDSIWSVAFSPDGTQLASGSQDQTIRLWDTQSGDQLRQFDGHTDSIRSVAFSPDGSQIISTSQDQTIRLWDAQTGAEVQQFTGHEGIVWSAAFSPDGAQIVSGGQDQLIILWDSQSGERLQQFTGHEGSVLSVAFSLDGAQIVSASQDQTIRLWDAQTGAEVQQFTGHEGSILSVAFSPDGMQIASASADQSIRLWDAQTGELRKQLDGHTDSVRSIAFNADGSQIVSGSFDQSIRFWHAKPISEDQPLEGHTNAVWTVAFSPDSQRIISAGQDQSIIIWEAQSRRQIQQINGHTDAIRMVAFSPDGAQIASASDDLTIRLWDARTGQQLKQFEGHTNAIWSVAFSPDGTHIVSAGQDLTVRLWDIDSGNQVRQFDGHTNSIRSVVFSPDGSQIVSGSFDQSVRLWDAESGEQLKQFDGHTDPVNAVAFSPDGSQIVSASDDLTIRLWNESTGEQRLQMDGHTSWIRSIAFSPDGTQILSGSSDKSIRLWDAQSGQQLRQFEGHTTEIVSVAFSPDGALIASGSDDQSIRLWPGSTAGLLQLADSLIQRDPPIFSDEERARYGFSGVNGANVH